MAEAIEFGVASLRESGIAVPPADVAQAELDDRFGLLYRWLDDTDPADDVAHPEIADPALSARSASWMPRWRRRTSATTTRCTGG
jgi:hypothetical protein